MGVLNRETEKPSLGFLLTGGEMRAGTPCESSPGFGPRQKDVLGHSIGT